VSEGFSHDGDVVESMKVVYCDRCRDISIKSRLEPETCNACGRIARSVPSPRPRQYYASSGVLLTAVALFVALPIPDFGVRLAILGAAVALAFLFASRSLRAMRARILRSVAHDVARREARP
jgi:hypothetical protein